MNIKLDLLKGYVADFVNNHIEELVLDADTIADTVAICLLEEIQLVVCNKTYSDFEVVEEIVTLF
ncbi:MAG: hypothetical protein IIU58_01670 [Clostridia bacterium]|nr:hypothetical protein [Clostridia bacterium]